MGTPPVDASSVDASSVDASQPQSIGRTRPEILSLTSLRGYLALWVVGYHFWNDLIRLFPSVEFATPVMQRGNMAVPAFFVLSGFVLAYNYAERFSTLRRADIVRFLGLRLVRIYPVHLVTLLAVVPMVLVGRRAGYQLTDSGYTLHDFVLNLFLVHTWVPDFKLNWNYPSWSISSEWFAYIFFPFAACLGQRCLKTRGQAASFALLAVGASTALMCRWRPWPFYELLLVVPTFLSGMGAYWMLRRPVRGASSMPVRILPEVLVLALVAGCYLPSDEVVMTWLLCGMFGLILILARLSADSGPLWTAWSPVFLGEVSYSLYMTHTLAQKVLYRLLPVARFESSGVVTRLGVVAAYAVLIALACLASYFLVERPCRLGFKRLLAGRASAGRSPA